jgi:hypothetical protein
MRFLQVQVQMLVSTTWTSQTQDVCTCFHRRFKLHPNSRSTNLHIPTSNAASPLGFSLMLGVFPPEMLLGGLFPRLHPILYPVLGLGLPRFPREPCINMMVEKSSESQCSSHHALSIRSCDTSLFNSFGNL